MMDAIFMCVNIIFYSHGIYISCLFIRISSHPLDDKKCISLINHAPGDQTRHQVLHLMRSLLILCSGPQDINDHCVRCVWTYTLWFITICAVECTHHGDVVTWKRFQHSWWRHQMEKKFPRYWPFMRGIHRSPVDSPQKGQWRGALMFLWSAPEKATEQIIETPVIWYPFTIIMTSLQWLALDVGNPPVTVADPPVWSAFGIVLRQTPNHFLNQYCPIVNWILRNKIDRHLIELYSHFYFRKYILKCRQQLGSGLKVPGHIWSCWCTTFHKYWPHPLVRQIRVAWSDPRLWTCFCIKWLMIPTLGRFVATNISSPVLI